MSLLVVPWGTDTWTKVTMDFTVQSTYYADGLGGAYAAGTAVTPTGFIPWVCAESNSWVNYPTTAENGVIYVYGAELYVNSTAVSVFPG